MKPAGNSSVWGCMMRLIPENQYEDELARVATQHMGLINAFIHIVAGVAILVTIDCLRYCLIDWAESQNSQLISEN
jgi:hypothetical protein